MEPCLLQRDDFFTNASQLRFTVTVTLGRQEHFPSAESVEEMLNNFILRDYQVPTSAY